MTTQEYITNCLLRIFSASCSPANETRRANDVAIIIYQNAGAINNIHLGLANLCNFAEQGRYAEKPDTTQNALAHRSCPACRNVLGEHSVYCDNCGTDTPRNG